MAQKKVERLTLDQERAIVEREEDAALSVRQQCELLGLNRSTLYYSPVPWNENDLRLMNTIDELFTKKPTLGVRQMMWRLRDKGFQVGKKRVRTLMRHMGLEAVRPKENTSKRTPDHPVYPYLLRDVPITRVNQV